MNQQHEELQKVQAALPACPGVYLFKDDAGKIIYVGKAKHLKKRVASYFVPPERLTPKTRAMVAQARGLDSLCTETEKEALLLENSLIKKHRPRYNIVLRDDKQYVLFKLTRQQRFARLHLTRRVDRDGAVYYGPFTSSLAAREAMKAILRAFPLRRCKDAVFKNRVRPCVYHDIGLCLGPCVLPVEPQRYAEMVHSVEMLLSGRSAELSRLLKREMHEAAERLEFERAALLRDQVAAIRRTVEDQAAVLSSGGDLDVVGLAAGEAGLALGLLFVRQGRLLDKKTFFWAGMGEGEAHEALGGFVAQYYVPGRFIPGRILLPPEFFKELEAEGEAQQAEIQRHTMELVLTERRGQAVRMAAPRGKAERRLAVMARTNAAEAARAGGEAPLEALLAKALKLPEEPRRIECVDVSHTGGSQTRAGVVVFMDGRPNKGEYRLYKLEGEHGGDDYAALAAWAGRRMESGPPWPDLLLIDGGRGQLAAVARGLEDAAGQATFPLAAIAKERQPGKGSRRHAGAVDQVWLPGRKNPLPLRQGSSALLYLQRIRDAAHGFVIGRHRRARQKQSLGSELLALPGLGPKTAKLLWDRFDSIEAMIAAGPEGLAELEGVGEKRAEALHAAIGGLRPPSRPEKDPEGGPENGQ